MDWWKSALLSCVLVGGCAEPLVESADEEPVCDASRSAAEPDDGGDGQHESFSYCDGEEPAAEALACEPSFIDCAGTARASADDCDFEMYLYEATEGSEAAMRCALEWVASGEPGRVRWTIEGEFNSAAVLEVARWQGREGLPVYRLRDSGGSSWSNTGNFGIPVGLDGGEDPIVQGARLCLDDEEAIPGHEFDCLMDVIRNRPSFECPDFEPEPDPPSHVPEPFEPDDC